MVRAPSEGDDDPDDPERPGLPFAVALGLAIMAVVAVSGYALLRMVLSL